MRCTNTNVLQSLEERREAGDSRHYLPDRQLAGDEKSAEQDTESGVLMGSVTVRELTETRRNRLLIRNVKQSLEEKTSLRSR